MNSKLNNILIYSRSSNLKEINISYTNKVLDFIIHFNKIELTSKNMLENLSLFKICLEILLNLIFNLENPSVFLLIVVKSSFILKEIQNKFEKIYAKKIKDDTCIDSWNQYTEIKEKLDFSIEKVKIFISDEGGDIQYTHNIDVTLL